MDAIDNLPDPETIDNPEDVLLSIQARLKVPKAQKNNYGGYNYRNLEDINQAIRPIAREYSSYITYTDKIVYIGDRYYVKATCALTTPHGNLYTSAYAREQESRKGMDASQITGSASSYARKYAAQGLFALGDDDADSMPPERQPGGPAFANMPSTPTTFEVRCRHCGNLGHDFSAAEIANTVCMRCGAVDWERIS